LNPFDQFDEPNPFDQFDAPQGANQNVPGDAYMPAETILDRVKRKVSERQPGGFNVLPAMGTVAATIAGPLGMAAKTALTPEIAEPMATMATGIAAEPVAGLAGIATLPQGPQKAAEAVEKTREALTYTPKTEPGKAAMQTAGETLAPVGEAIDYIPKAMGDYALELTGSPELATAVYTAPYAVAELLGLKGLNKIKKGTQLIDSAGKPTKKLRVFLNKKGLDFDNLTPEAKAVIPAVADEKFFVGATTKGSAEKALIAQIKSGGRDNALAPLKVVGEKVVNDSIAMKAIKQGFGENYVQMIKTSSPATRHKMRKMLNITKRINKNASLETKMRATDIAGESLNNRVNFIRNKANTARKELDNIARTKLKGISIDSGRVTNRLTEILDDLDIKITSAEGKPTIDFAGSAIAKDPSSQKAIKNTIDLLAYGGKPDALRAHKLKRQLDSLIDFSKKGPQGLGKEGKSALKAIRHELNQVVREVNPQYADVNDVLSTALDTIEKLDKATGTVSLTSPNSATGLGTSLRKLTSNYASRESLMTALDDLDSAIAKFGGKFDDSLTDLVSFSNALDDRFGTTAKTSFSGQVEQATKRAVSQGLASSAKEAIAETASKGVNKLRGVNDFNAFEAMDELLKQ